MKPGMRWLLTSLSLALLAAAAGALYAQEVAMLSTGVGKEERVPHAGYSVLLVFSEKSGPLLADIKVTVKNKAGKAVVETTSEGPWLFLKLPAGTYKVEATRTSSGKAVTGTVTAPASGQARLALRW